MDPALREMARRLVEKRKPEPGETDPRVLEMVREQLGRSRPPTLAGLYGRAVRIDPEIRKLDPREFRKRYVVPVERARKPKRATRRRARRARPKAAARNGANAAAEHLRPRIRALLLEYAKTVAAAETRPRLLDAIVAADRYAEAVARVLTGEDDGR